MNASTAFILIDAQVNMFDPAHPVSAGEELLETLSSLLARARSAHVPIVFVRNCGGPDDPDVAGTNGWQLHPRFEPLEGELVLDKTTSDAFESTTLGEELETRGVRHVVIAGLQSEYCVRATTLQAHARGLEVTLASNGHSTYDSRELTAREISASVNAELEATVKLAGAEDIRFG
ncbi:MAG: isochorismatase family protein [Candidatus Eisenbacteria bacterium]|uniref:Isochorismatase family protein n=1 Tax=Eiseniibacteriota bacterium TaxID=2212470 RepID=A0A538TH27_UNCEI|nr:MAG: isochorismatase family protein [Candidatus Eisenbacteria bacterium]